MDEKSRVGQASDVSLCVIVIYILNWLRVRVQEWANRALGNMQWL